MSPTLEVIVHAHGEKLASHDARIRAGEKRQDKAETKLDRIFYTAIATLTATVGVLLNAILKH